MLMGLQEFSNGCHGRVYHATPENKLNFPRCDLVKSEDAEDPLHHKKVYYQHKIAQALFPNNFIEVVGSAVCPPYPKLTFPRSHLIFSKKAEVDKSHAVYSAHMGLYNDFKETIKRSTCECSDCTSHRDFHAHSGLHYEALSVFNRCLEIGLKLPYRDSSDYCMGENGIVFFEITHLDPDKLGCHLRGIRNRSTAEQNALNFLERYQQISPVTEQEPALPY